MKGKHLFSQQKVNKLRREGERERDEKREEYCDRMKTYHLISPLEHAVKGAEERGKRRRKRREARSSTSRVEEIHQM
jgi:hypothetical protein